MCAPTRSGASLRGGDLLRAGAAQAQAPFLGFVIDGFRVGSKFPRNCACHNAVRRSEIHLSITSMQVVSLGRAFCCDEFVCFLLRSVSPDLGRRPLIFTCFDFLAARASRGAREADSSFLLLCTTARRLFLFPPPA